jgi:hemin uptake protein HemP
MIVEETEPAPSNGEKTSTPLPGNRERVFESGALFGGAREIRIRHNGESYLLRLTRLGKLILTK